MSDLTEWWRRKYAWVLIPLSLSAAIWYGGSVYGFYQEHDRFPVSDWEMLSWITGL